jgi:hypothetical protein
MATEKRIKIITESEVQEFYSPPFFTTNDQRFFFALDDREQEACKKVRQRRSRGSMTYWDELLRLSCTNGITYLK